MGSIHVASLVTVLLSAQCPPPQQHLPELAHLPVDRSGAGVMCCSLSLAASHFPMHVLQVKHLLHCTTSQAAHLSHIQC